ncbi:30S ribosomal protein S17 [Candidatus Woesearchaeota archaeon CG1_02_47_18]|nr:MAG: 30S ribosomal protein S17 [Candidatus Woesearchaeota archaeon CG1_02_47_18]
MACNDEKCPFHGKLSLRGRVLSGIISSGGMHRTATFLMERLFYIPKYQRYERRRTKLKVHNPPCIEAQKGDRVRVMECRPLSKTKKFVIIQKLG